MKKGGAFLLVTITLVFAAFTAGLLVGRQINQGAVTVHLSTMNSVAETLSAATISAKDTATKVNINTATLSELDTLPGIGPVLALRIIDYRTEHGPFESPSDLSKVDGIGLKKLITIIDMITVED